MFKNQGRRAMDRFPVTDRLTWAFLRHIDRARNVKPIDALCFVGAGLVYGGGMWVVANWLFGA